MGHTYDDIPATGQHRGEGADQNVTSSVRAQEARSELAPPPKPVHRVFRLTLHEPEGYYQLRAWTTEEPDTPLEGTREIGRYGSQSELTKGLASLPGEDRFVVFEDSATGELYYEREQNVTGDWLGDTQFDQVSIFSTEEAAAAYVERRKRAP